MNATTENEVSPIVELDAREFGLHLKEGGWRLGLLVARSVEPGEGQGQLHDERHEVRLEMGEKLSATKFAELADTSSHRVMRYYRAWERYASKGKVPNASNLAPGDEPELDWTRLPKWSLSEFPTEHGATGPLNLHIRLGRIGQRLARTHRGFRTFLVDDLTTGKPGKDVRELAGKYALCLETDAQLLRAVERGDALPETDELKQQLDLANFFEVER